MRIQAAVENALEIKIDQQFYSRLFLAYVHIPRAAILNCQLVIFFFSMSRFTLCYSLKNRVGRIHLL